MEEYKNESEKKSLKQAIPKGIIRTVTYMALCHGESPNIFLEITTCSRLDFVWTIYVESKMSN